MRKVLVTGGAGFIGSHLVDRLVEDSQVVVLDDLSTGLIENIFQHIDNRKIEFIQGSILNEEDLNRALEGVTTVFHFAAQPDVRVSVEKPFFDFEVNVVGGMKLLEAMRRANIMRLVFVSSGGTVYGEPERFPTPENTPLRPISNYGAAKAAFEMYLSSYAELYEMVFASMRLANVIGPRSTHGVIYDFVKKLEKDPSRLVVLGDGTQNKEYISVTDVVAAAICIANNMKEGHVPVNVGSGETLTITRIAKIVCEEMDSPDAKIEYTMTKRGWDGDVVRTDVDISLLKSMGWNPMRPIEDTVRQYIRWLRSH
ncbi:MAG: GDP-mannose 4,6-dehydratase [Candidatus Thorarchaeota archaeon]|nr:GDP-mannose 4,6-dehydratase [Candidatus Thorarchaeota archaeon]